MNYLSQNFQFKFERKMQELGAIYKNSSLGCYISKISTIYLLQKTVFPSAFTTKKDAWAKKEHIKKWIETGLYCYIKFCLNSGTPILQNCHCSSEKKKCPELTPFRPGNFGFSATGKGWGWGWNQRPEVVSKLRQFNPPLAKFQNIL